jgi:hypothetical protein
MEQWQIGILWATPVESANRASPELSSCSAHVMVRVEDRGAEGDGDQLSASNARLTWSGRCGSLRVGDMPSGKRSSFLPYTAEQQ